MKDGQEPMKDGQEEVTYPAGASVETVLLDASDVVTGDFASVTRIVFRAVAGESTLTKVATGATITARTVVGAVVQICQENQRTMD